MAREPMGWVHRPPQTKKSKIPEALKTEVETRATKFIDLELNAKFVKSVPKKPRFNYLVAIYTKWHGRYFFFCGTYRCPGPKATALTFETRFARLEFVGRGKFALAYLRHNDKWFVLQPRLTLDKCFEALHDPLFWPF